MQTDCHKLQFPQVFRIPRTEIWAQYGKKQFCLITAVKQRWAYLAFGLDDHLLTLEVYSINTFSNLSFQAIIPFNIVWWI
jgi:hypothetical protein